MSELLERLKERKVVRWALAYVAGAWVVVEVTGQLGQLFDVPLPLQRGVVILLGFGLVLTVALAWFHGKDGPQRVSGTELVVVAVILGLTGAALTLLRDGDGVASDSGDMAPMAVADDVASTRSVAVLPFLDMSPGGDQAYFGEGVAEEVRGVLHGIDGLRVASSTSSLSVEDRGLDPAEIGRRLGVTHLVEGSVRKSAERLRIEARLVRVDEGFPEWSARFDTDAADIFAVQDSIARAVARAFEVGTGTGTEQTIRLKGQTADPEAQDLYLRARYAWNRRTRDGLEESVRFFSDAIERDPSYGRALAGLGDAYAVLGFYDHRPPAEAFPLAQEAARAALAIDSTMAEPYATLGYAALYHDRDWAAAEDHFRTSIRLDPGYPVAHQWYANFLTAMGRFEEAVHEMRTASELDPLSMIAMVALGWVHFFAREHDAAVRQLEAALRRDPSFELAHLWQGQALAGLGRVDEAEAAIGRYLELSSGGPLGRAALARVFAITDREGQATALLEGLEEEGRRGYVPRYEMATVRAALGDHAGALRELRTAVAERSHSVVLLAVDPQLDPLREDPAFGALVEAVGLTSVAARLR